MAGAFTLLGTGILRAVMPTTPQFSQADATKEVKQDSEDFKAEALQAQILKP